MTKMESRPEKARTRREMDADVGDWDLQGKSLTGTVPFQTGAGQDYKSTHSLRLPLSVSHMYAWIYAVEKQHKKGINQTNSEHILHCNYQIVERLL